LEVFYLADLLKKKQHAVNVVKTALDKAGARDRAVCAGGGNETPLSACGENFAVFVSAPSGADIEPYYETGKTLAEAVRKVLAAIKGIERNNGTKADAKSEPAPF
jgi:hypothetical protein